MPPAQSRAPEAAANNPGAPGIRGPPRSGGAARPGAPAARSAARRGEAGAPGSGHRPVGARTARGTRGAGAGAGAEPARPASLLASPRRQAVSSAPDARSAVGRDGAARPWRHVPAPPAAGFPPPFCASPRPAPGESGSRGEGAGLFPAPPCPPRRSAWPWCAPATRTAAWRRTTSSGKRGRPGPPPCPRPAAARPTPARRCRAPASASRAPGRPFPPRAAAPHRIVPAAPPGLSGLSGQRGAAARGPARGLRRARGPGGLVPCASCLRRTRLRAGLARAAGAAGSAARPLADLWIQGCGSPAGGFGRRRTTPLSRQTTT